MALGYTLQERFLYGADGDFKAVVNSLEDAKICYSKNQSLWRFFLSKVITSRVANNAKMVMQAARELDILVVPEGGSTFFHNLSMIQDGHTGVEHNLPVAPLYNDVISFWKETKTHNTPTLVVSYGAVSGEYYWYQHTNVWEQDRLLAFTPRAVVDSRARHRTMLPEEEYKNGHILIF